MQKSFQTQPRKSRVFGFKCTQHNSLSLCHKCDQFGSVRSSDTAHLRQNTYTHHATHSSLDLIIYYIQRHQFRIELFRFWHRARRASASCLPGVFSVGWMNSFAEYSSRQYTRRSCARGAFNPIYWFTSSTHSTQKPRVQTPTTQPQPQRRRRGWRRRLCHTHAHTQRRHTIQHTHEHTHNTRQ